MPLYSADGKEVVTAAGLPTGGDDPGVTGASACLACVWMPRNSHCQAHPSLQACPAMYLQGSWARVRTLRTEA
eukprot:365603-Chlamydomonas_euryale.AAC.10